MRRFELLTRRCNSLSAPKTALPKKRMRRYTPSSLVEHSRGANEKNNATEHSCCVLDERPPVGMPRRNEEATAEFLCVLGLREYQHYPASG